ncbi:gloverin-like [Choristoneura fumiferana]|uniref:gloverin-like n=1 Tax=Choristoneura fumiferana TaxID=7141 RepID=UPI003D15DD2F
MQYTFVSLAALVSVATSAKWTQSEKNMCDLDPVLCRLYFKDRFGPGLSGKPNDITWNKQIGNGKVFGTLGSTDQALFGQAGYKQVIFNDARGKLEGQAQGTRVLSPNGDSSHLGGTLKWSNDNANAALDVSKQIGGPTSISATGAGKWNLDKNTEVSAGGTVSHSGHGKPDVAVQAQIEHKF